MSEILSQTGKKSKAVAIVQSNYIPWKGYFDLINMVDEFILYDEVQYTRRDWRNRNKIKTPNGLKWLTIPVDVKGKYYQKIKDTKISNRTWMQRHWKSIILNYSKAKYFKAYKDLFEDLYLNTGQEYLSEVNYRFLAAICKILGISTKITFSGEYQLSQGKTEKLIDICRQANADIYLSGPAAKSYINEDLFKQADIELRYMDYSGYPEYRQLYGPFEHSVSVIDLIFNEGPDAIKYMKSF